MITAIEVNILLNALVPNEKFYEPSVRALEKHQGLLWCAIWCMPSFAPTSRRSANAKPFLRRTRFESNR